MTTELATLKGIILFGAKVIAPALLPSIMFADGLIDEKTLMPLTVVVVVGGACWYIGDFVRGVRDDRQTTNQRFREIEKLLIDLKTASDEARAHHQKICPVLGCKVDFETGVVTPKNKMSQEY